MVEQWREMYANQSFNAEIAATASQDFAASQADSVNRVRYGSMNSLVVSNLSDESIRLILDNNTFTELGQKGIAVIEPRDGMFFNLIRVTNLSATTAIPAIKVSIRWGRSDPVNR